MARQFIEHLQPGHAVDEVYVIQTVEIRSARNGSNYLTLRLADRTGTIDAVKWDASENLYGHVSGADFLRVRGRVEVYRNKSQLVLSDLRPAEAEPTQLADFLPHTQKDVDALMKELRATVDSLQNAYIQKLILSFLEEPEFVAAFKRAPAAVSYHHPFIGGLLEHICSVIWVTDRIVENYPELNRDLLIAGIFFHDIGKVRELAVGAGFSYSDEGELVGHISLGILMVQERAARVDGFPSELLMQITHLILSHHGELEYGSPKVPMTVEAIALHHLENLDAKINSFSMALKSDLQDGQNWTSYNRMFGRRLYKTPQK